MGERHIFVALKVYGGIISDVEYANCGECQEEKLGGWEVRKLGGRPAKPAARKLGC